MFRTTIAIGNARKETLIKKLNSIIKQYEARGFTVSQIHGDNQFTCLSEELLEKKITFQPVAANSHEPFIERDNRTSKERCRCTVVGLPFNQIPRRMIMELPPTADFWLNYWCSSGGVSATVPPRQIITGLQLDAHKHCKFQFSDYILAFTSSDNTLKERAIDGIYLRPTGSADGAFWVMNLATGQRVRRIRATLAHMTDSIIRRVEEIAEQEGMPAGFIMHDRDHNLIDHVRIGDLDTESVASIDDDDNASDGTFEPDDSSVDTTLENHVNETVENEEWEPIQNEEWDNQPPNAENRNDQLDNINDGTANTNVADVVEAGVNGDNTVVNNPANNITDITENNENEEEANNDDDGYGEEDEHRHNLRGSVNRINARTFEPEIHQRHALFSAGFSKATKKLEKDHQVYCFITQAAETYNNLDASLVTPQYSVERGLKIFKELGSEAVLKELQQMHDMNVVTPQHVKELREEDIRNALPYLMFLKRKRCGKIKCESDYLSV